MDGVELYLEISYNKSITKHIMNVICQILCANDDHDGSDGSETIKSHTP